MQKTTSIHYTREELFQKVWELPLRILAAELGMSDVGLRKLCHRNGIPTPPQGYHLMAEGPRKNRLIRQLPEPTPEQETEFVFKNTDKEFEESTSKMELEWEKQKNTATTKPDSKQVKQIHKVIKSITSQLNKKKLDERGIVRIPKSTFPIRTSPKMIDKAVDVLETLFQRLITMGASIPETTESNSRLLLATQWMNYEFSVRIEEFTNRFEVPVSERPKRSYTLYKDQWKYIPTGKLTIKVNGPGYGTMTMRDGRKTINERMDELIKRMFIQAYEQNKKDKLHKARTLKAIEHLKKKDLIRREKKFQKLREKKLLCESRAWKRTEEIRSYLQEIESSGEAIFNSESEKSEWIKWAKSYVDSIDPIKQHSASILPDFPKENEITGVPWFYLDFDDPEEAEENYKNNYY